VHFPAAGVPAVARSVPGRYDASGPYPRRRLLPFYSENHRMVTCFASDRFGPMALVEVGALTVGSIRQAFEPGRPVAKGAHKACFALGGSTVVIVFSRGAVSFDADLVGWSARGLETGLRMGERIGSAACSAAGGEAP
jgi:phosphatidylserine decarboxylase